MIDLLADIGEVVVEEAGILEEAYWIGLGAILVLSVIKALLVAGYYQHLRFEPRSIAFVALSGLITALALTIASSYSIA